MVFFITVLRVLAACLITMVYLLLGAYTLAGHSLFAWLIYPTGYHFIASIVLLYIPFYFILRIQWLRDRLPRSERCSWYTTC